MKTAFICYETYDLNFVEQLVADLDRRKISCWYDVRDLSIGEAREVEIQKAIQNCEHVLIILSGKSVSSKPVLFELSYAKVEKKPITPILIEDCNIPKQLAQIKCIDFRSNYQKGLKQVIDQLFLGGQLQKDDIDRTESSTDKIKSSIQVENRESFKPGNRINQSKNIEIKDAKVQGDVFIGEKHTGTDSAERAFQVKPVIQIITISIGLVGIGFPIWWFLNNSSKDVVAYLFLILIIVLSILITLIGVLVPDQLVKIILSVLGSKKSDG